MAVHIEYSVALNTRILDTMNYMNQDYVHANYRGLACDVINDVTDGRRHIGGIFLRRTGRFNGNNVRKRPKIGHFSGPIKTFQCI
jgi:hypothetical protein